MAISIRALRGLSTALALIGLTSPAGEDEAAPVPRYRLKVGQELEYHETSDFKYDNGLLGHATDWQVWVVRANDDGGRRLVLRASRKATRSASGREEGGGPAHVTMAHCDLFPDGRIVPNDSFGFRLDPSPLFPQLPDDAEQANDGWQETDARQGTRTEFERSGAAEADRNEWVCDGVRRSPMDKIYLSTSQARYVFDGALGLVKRVESRSMQGYGFNGKGTGTTELTAVEEQDAWRVETFAKEADRYFEANREYQGLQAKASKDAKEVGSILSQAESTLKDARESLTLPVLREQVDAQLKDHARMTSYDAQEAKNRAAVLGRDAAEWETKDLQGQTHPMKGYRGKVGI